MKQALAIGLSFAMMTVAAAAKDLKIGVEVGLTGPYSFAGVPSREGMEIALEQINASGKLGANRIRLDIQDTAGDNAQDISLSSRFGGDPDTLMMVGPTSSGEAIAAAAVANQLQLPMLTATALSEQITHTGQWIFKTPAGSADIIKGIVDYASEKLKVKKVAFVYARDNQGQIGQMDAAKQFFPQHGITIISEDTVVASDTDFSAIVTKIASESPDAVYVTLTGDQAANFIVQARQAGMDPAVKFLGTPNMGSDRFIAVGGDAVEGAVFVSDYFNGSTSPQNKVFVDAYTKKYGHLPDDGAALGYAAINLAALAMENSGANPTRAAIRDALAGIRDVPTVLGNGTFSFDADRNPRYEAVVLTVSGGKFVVAP